jgi:hypothetical protein
MKKNILLFTFLLLTFLSCPVFAQYSGGTGEPDTPYLISTPDDMNAVGANPADWDKHFLLTNDIDMAGFTYTTAFIAPDISSSHGFQGTAFTGVFDGAGFKVINLTIEIVGAYNDYLGLFGYIASTGTLENLGAEDVNITVGDNSRCLGGLVGENRGIISSCYATGLVTGGDHSKKIGGLCGRNESGTISNCFSTGSVTGEYNSRCLGGLVGCNYEGICFKKKAKAVIKVIKIRKSFEHVSLKRGVRFHQD